MSGLMCFLSSAFVSLAISGGTPGSSGWMATSSSSSDAIWWSACTALILGSGFVSLTTQPPALASNAPHTTQPARRIILSHLISCDQPRARARASSLSLGVLLVLDVFVPELLFELGVCLL